MVVALANQEVQAQVVTVMVMLLAVQQLNQLNQVNQETTDLVMQAEVM